MQNLNWSWRKIVPEEGVYDFQSLREAIQSRAAECDGVLLHMRASVWEQVIERRGKKRVEEGTAPRWSVEKEGYLYAIRLKANAVLEREVEHLLTLPVGRPSRKPKVFYHSF